MRKNIEERVQSLECRDIVELESQINFKNLTDRIELLEKIIEGLGYYIPARKP